MKRFWVIPVLFTLSACIQNTSFFGQDPTLLRSFADANRFRPVPEKVTQEIFFEAQPDIALPTPVSAEETPAKADTSSATSLPTQQTQQETPRVPDFYSNQPFFYPAFPQQPVSGEMMPSYSGNFQPKPETPADNMAGQTVELPAQQFHMANDSVTMEQIQMALQSMPTGYPYPTADAVSEQPAPVAIPAPAQEMMPTSAVETAPIPSAPTPTVPTAFTYMYHPMYPELTATCSEADTACLSLYEQQGFVRIPAPESLSSGQQQEQAPVVGYREGTAEIAYPSDNQVYQNSIPRW